MESKSRFNSGGSSAADSPISSETVTLDGTLPKIRNVPKGGRRKKHPSGTVKEEDIEGAELTEKQRLFCLYYIKSFNATMAAIKAGYFKETAHVIGWENLRKPKIAKQMRRLKGTMTKELFIDAMDEYYWNARKKNRQKSDGEFADDFKEFLGEIWHFNISQKS